MASSSSNNPTNFEQHELVAKVFAEPRIYDRIFKYCTPATFIRCSRTCKVANNAVKDWSARAFDIDKHLRRFVKNPTTFRSLMAETGSVIAGSNALQFFDRVYYPSSDLDLYVYYDSMRSVVKYIRHSTGKHYRYTPRGLQNQELEDEMHEMEKKETDKEKRRLIKRQFNALRRRDGMTTKEKLISPYVYWGPWTKGVLTFESNRGDDGHPLKIQLILSPSSPMQSILSFHSS